MTSSFNENMEVNYDILGKAKEFLDEFLIDNDLGTVFDLEEQPGDFR